MSHRISYVLLATLTVAACNSTDTLGPRTPDDSGIPPSAPPPPPVNYSEAHPLTDLVREDGVADMYLGFEGGLYFDNNDVPSAHAEFGSSTASQIQPLDTSGAPDPDGAIVLMSISMSNAAREWCRSITGGTSGAEGCEPHTFMDQTINDSSISDNLVIVNGSRPKAALRLWDSPDDEDYSRVATEVLPDFGLTEAQVQIVWVKAALKQEPTRPSLPNANADAYALEATIGDVVRALRERYPSLKQIFFTSRIYGGYAAPNRNSPEPWAYETGFGTKWAIEAQIEQRATGVMDQVTGNLDGMPFMAWGPYIWSYGDRPREDGLIWTRDLLRQDGIHPSEAGARIVADYLLDFFKTSPFTRCWFIEGLTCS